VVVMRVYGEGRGRRVVLAALLIGCISSDTSSGVFQIFVANFENIVLNDDRLGRWLYFI